jgi:uncharacterized protein YndB with AHSA1/START domain
MCNHSVAMASVKRTLLLDLPPDEVWRAISDETMLREWLAPEVELDPRPNGRVLCRTESGEERPGAVELVEEGERLAFRWWRDGASDASRVELRLEEVEGGTRLTVTETGLEAQAAPQASEGWRTRLESLRAALAELAYA